jgi:hypothetical protein
VFYDSSTEPKLYELGIDFRNNIGEEDEYYASFTAETKAKYQEYLRSKEGDTQRKTPKMGKAKQTSPKANSSAKAK